MKRIAALLCCLFQCLPLWSADFQKAKVVAIGTGTVENAPTVINSQPVQPLAGPPIPGSGPVVIDNSETVILLTVEIGPNRYTAQFPPKSLYGKHAFPKRGLVLGTEVTARLDTDVKRGNFLRHWHEDELVLQTPEGSTVWGVVVQSALSK